MSPLPDAPRSHRLAVALLALALALVGALTSVPGPLTIDDTTYHLMARDWLATGELSIRNGFAETPSAELQLYVPGTTSHVAAHGGRLVAQYPYLSPVLALPLFAWGGFAGLAWLSALASGLAVILCWGLARRTVDDPVAALAAPFLLGTGTLFVNQIQGATPMMVGLCFALSGWLLLERGLASAGRAALVNALGAGLLIGLGAGARLDVVVLGPVMGVACLLAAPSRLGLAVAVGLGMLPGLGALSLTNLAKFGDPSPFTYGNSVAYTAGTAAYLPVAALGGLAALGLGMARWGRSRAWIAAHPRATIGLTGGLLAVVMAIDPAREAALLFARGAATLAVDLRWMTDRGHEPTDQVTASGATLFWGACKKALLQSSPALVLALAPAWRGLREGARGAPRLRLALLPLALLGMYGWRTYHGGGCLQLRYFLNAMPFLVVLVAEQATATLRREGPGGRVALGVGLALAGVGGLTLDGLLSEEARALDLPLGVAAALALLSLARARWLGGVAPGLALAASLGLALGWGSVSAFVQDLPVERRERALRLRQAEEIAARVSDPSLLVVTFPERVSAALDSQDMLLAMPILDEGADLGKLVAWYSARGRACYGFLPDRRWRAWASHGIFDTLSWEPVWRDEDWELRLLRPRDEAPP